MSYLCRVVLCTASSLLALSHFVCCLHAVFSLLYGGVLTCGTTGWTILTTLPTMLSLSFSALFYRSLFVERAIETCFTCFSFRSPAPWWEHTTAGRQSAMLLRALRGHRETHFTILKYPFSTEKYSFSYIEIFFLFSFWWGTVSLSKLAHVHIVNHLYPFPAHGPVYWPD